jgi:hypothetical protein
VWDQISDPYKRYKSKFLYILIVFLVTKVENKRFCTESWQAFVSSFLNFFMKAVLIY